MPEPPFSVTVVEARRLVREGVCAMLSNEAGVIVTAAARCADVDLSSGSVLVIGDVPDADVADVADVAVVVWLSDLPDPSKLATTLRDVARTPPTSRSALLKRPVSAALTPRERQILREIGRGRSAAEIGLLLGISPRTVERHRQSVTAKLRSGTSAGAIARTA